MFHCHWRGIIKCQHYCLLILILQFVFFCGATFQYYRSILNTFIQDLSGNCENNFFFVYSEVLNSDKSLPREFMHWFHWIVFAWIEGKERKQIDDEIVYLWGKIHEIFHLIDTVQQINYTANWIICVHSTVDGKSFMIHLKDKLGINISK